MRYLYTILILSLFYFATFAQTAPAWEYAFSETEYQGSLISDILMVGDSVLVAGAKNTCHTPGIWVFDDMGNLLSFKDLTPAIDSGFLYGYGKITELKYDSISHEILAIGLVAPADDVGAHTAYMYKLSHQLDVISSFDFTEIANHTDQSISFIDSGYAVQEGSQVYILDPDFALLKKLDFPIEPFEQYVATYDDDTLFTYLISGHGIGNTITSYSETEDTINHIAIHPFDQFILFNNYIMVVDTNDIIRKYRKSDLSLVDSILNEQFDQVEIEKISGGTIATIGYQKDSKTEIKILTEEFETEETFETDLENERHISIYPHLNQYYLSGRFYDQLGIYGSVIRGLVPFIRKQSVQEPMQILRPNLSIINVELTAVLQLDEPAFYSMTIENTGSHPISQFGYHTTRLGGFNCIDINSYRAFDSLELLPGLDTTIIDSLYFLHNIPDSIDFYVVGPNHLLHEGDNSFTITDITTTTTRFNTEKITVYPNPATDQIKFEMPDPLEQILVVGVDGQKIIADKNNDNLVNISGLVPGMYFLQIRTRTKNYQSRFVKL